MSTRTSYVTFDSVQLGDEIPSFTISETQETIDGAVDPEAVAENEARGIGQRKNIHNDLGFAKRGLFGGTVNGGVTTMAYINQMLEQWFPPEALFNGGSLTFKAIEPFRPGDTMIFTGVVTGKSIEGGRPVVSLDIRATNQHGRISGVAEATVVLDK